MPRGVAIFDFDCTLTKFHVWGRFRKAPLKEVLIDADTFVDAQAFKEFVAKARRSDLEVAIATFGRRDVVNKALEFALGERHNVTISTPADHVDPRFDFPQPLEDAPPSAPLGTVTTALVPLPHVGGGGHARAPPPQHSGTSTAFPAESRHEGQMAQPSPPRVLSDEEGGHCVGARPQEKEGQRKHQVITQTTMPWNAKVGHIRPAKAICRRR